MEELTKVPCICVVWISKKRIVSHLLLTHFSISIKSENISEHWCIISTIILSLFSYSKKIKNIFLGFRALNLNMMQWKGVAKNASAVEGFKKICKWIIWIYNLDKVYLELQKGFVWWLGFFKFCSLAQNLPLEMSHNFVSCKSEPLPIFFTQRGRINPLEKKWEKVG